MTRSASVNMVTHCRQLHGMRVMSVPHGSPGEMVEKPEALREVGVGYMLLNGGGSGGGERAQESLPIRSCRRCRISKRFGS